MLARGSELARGSYGYEVKWDGFRAIVATGRDFRARSRRGWDMTTLLPEPHAMPDGLVLDGRPRTAGPTMTWSMTAERTARRESRLFAAPQQAAPRVGRPAVLWPLGANRLVHANRHVRHTAGASTSRAPSARAGASPSPSPGGGNFREAGAREARRRARSMPMRHAVRS
jgi:hypothetical protein